MKIEDLNILYEDNHIIVVVKPQNIPTQKDESEDQDMLSLIKEYIKVKYNKPGNVFVGLVHRLDRPTGGLLVFAKTSKSASRLSEQIQNGEFDKRYLTVVVGAPIDKTRKLEHYLKKDESTNIVKIVPRSEEGVKKAELIYNVLDTYNEYIEIPIVKDPRRRLSYNEILTKPDENSIQKPKERKNPDEPIKIPKTTETKTINTLSLVEVELLTGRSHQIRVQMSSLKTPVYGDVKYGDVTRGEEKDDNENMTRNLALWAYKLNFIHPTTKQLMSFKVLPPIDKEPWIKFSKSETFCK